MNFTDYLHSIYHYSEKSIEIKQKHILTWKEHCLESQKLEKLQPEEILKITEHLKKQYTEQTVNNHLKSLEQYYYFLVETGKIKEHPLQGFRIKTGKEPLLDGFLTQEELDIIYENYPVKGHWSGQFDLYAQRNKVILGFIIYQGLNTGSLEQMEIQDLDLVKARVSIRQSSDYKFTKRILPLEAVQIMELQTYIEYTRKKLIELREAYNMENAGLKMFPKNKKTDFGSVSQSIRKKIQTYYPLNSLLQLRQSQIKIWLKHYNLREVQYKSGYKRLKSLERYNADELEELKQAVEKYHPF